MLPAYVEQNAGVRMDFSGGKGDFLLFGGFCHYFGVLSAREVVELLILVFRSNCGIAWRRNERFKAVTCKRWREGV